MKGCVVLALLALISVSACTGRTRSLPPPPVVEEEPVEVPYLEHRVRYSGESLALIAQWYTGKNRNWAAIKDANPGLKPERIRIGQVILIPRALLVKEEPLPQSFVRRGGGAPSVKPPREVGSAPSEGGVSDGSEGVASPSHPPQPPSTQPEPARAPAATKQAAPTEDAERERLLDELLQ